VQTESSLIHPTAIVEDGANLGEGCRVWHWVHICHGAQIGEACSFGQNVFVGNDVVIGRNVKVQNNVSIYDGVRLADNVFCGPSMVFTNVLNPRSAVNRRSDYAQTFVEQGATFGANSTIICGVHIRAHAFIGAGTVVTRNVPAFALVVGNPARQIGWMSRNGERLDLPLFGQGTARCPANGELYRLDGQAVDLLATGNASNRSP